MNPFSEPSLQRLLILNLLFLDPLRVKNLKKLRIKGRHLFELALCHLERLGAGTPIWTLTNVAENLPRFVHRKSSKVFSLAFSDPAEPSYSFFARAFREILVKQNEDSSYDHVLLLNGMNPLLTPDIIDGLLRRYVSCGRPVLASARRLLHAHPALTWSYRTITQNGMLVFLDPSVEGVPTKNNDLQGKGLLVSKGFSFGWKRYIRRDFHPERLYVSEFSRNNFAFRPAETSHDLGDKELWWSVSPNEARRIWTRDTAPNVGHGWRLAALPIYPASNRPTTLLAHHDGEMFCLMGVRTPGSRLLDLAFESAEGPVFHRVKAEKEQRGLVFACSRLAETPWLFYCLSKPLVETGGADIWDRFAIPDLWRVCRETQTIRCGKTGQVLKGRQQFPPVYEIDGNIMMFETKVLDEVEKILISGQTQAYPLDETVSTGTVSNDFDFFKAKVFYGSLTTKVSGYQSGVGKSPVRSGVSCHDSRYGEGNNRTAGESLS